MKKLLGVIAIATALAVTAWAAEKVTETQLPAAVQKTLNQHKGTDTVKDIEKGTRGGQTVYEVEFNRRGLNPKLVIAENGTVVRDARGTIGEQTETRVNTIPEEVAVRIPSMRIGDVPAQVRATIEQQAKGRKVADIDRETWNGKTVYEVEFDQTGRNAQVHIAEDGTIVKHEQRPGETVTKAVKGLFLGTQLSDTPPAVQQTITRESNGLEIADIDKERRTGRVLYEVEFKNPGKNIELHIAEDGTIVRDSRRDVRGQGAPGSEPQTRTGRVGAGTIVTLDKVPVAVQQTIRTQGDITSIKQIERGEKGGRVVYYIEFEKQGLNKKIRVAEDGTVLKE